MDQQQYQEEYYEDYTPPSNKWLWAVTILAVIAAIVFAVLWYLRGGAVDRLTSEMQTAQSSAETAARRLQTDLDQARSDLAAGQAKATDLETRVQEEQRRAADAARQAENRLRSELDAQAARLADADSQMEDLRRQLAEATEREHAAQSDVAAASAARQQLAAVQTRLNAALAAGARADNVEKQLAAARKTIAELETTVGNLKAGGSTVGRELTSATEQLRQADADRQELSSARARLAKAEADLAEAGEDSARLSRERESLVSAHAAQLTAARNREQTLRTSLADLETKLRAATAAAAEKAATAAGAGSAAEAQLAALNARLAEAGRNIGALEKKAGDLEANRDKLAKELTSASEEARAAKAAGERMEKALAEARQRGERAERAMEDRMREAGDALKTRERELIEAGNAFRARERELSETVEAFRARERELLQDFERQREEWRRQVEALQDTMMRTEQSRQAEQADSGIGEREEPPSSAAQAVGGEPRHVIKGNPARFVGRVVQALPDNRTFLITGGVRQRVGPGMVFDVHRCLAGANMNRYIGLLRVTRVLDDFSLAILTSPSHEARVCPVTGRVVLDQTKTASPYAEVEGGRPVPLISAASLGLGGEMPAVGDVIDNPYYDPGRSLVFSVGTGVKTDPRVAPMVGGVGGVLAGDAKGSDYQVVGEGEAGAHPRQVTLDMLANYLEPSLPLYRQ